MVPQKKATEVPEVISQSDETAAPPPARARLGRWGRAAAVPAAVLAVALASQVLPAARTALQFDRAAISAGQWWRLVSCHLTHFGWPHLLAQ